MQRALFLFGFGVVCFGWLVWLFFFFLRMFKNAEAHDKRSDIAMLTCFQEVRWDLELSSTASCVCLSVSGMPACVVLSRGDHACLAGIGAWAACRTLITKGEDVSSYPVTFSVLPCSWAILSLLPCKWIQTPLTIVKFKKKPSNSKKSQKNRRQGKSLSKTKQPHQCGELPCCRQCWV